MSKNTQIPAIWNLPEEVNRRLGSKAGKQRVIAESDHILILLHKVPKKSSNLRESLFLWRNDKGEWHSSERGNGLKTLKDFLESFSHAVDRLEESYECATVSTDFFKLLEELAPLQRTVKNMSRTLQEARQIVGVEMINYRDHSEELFRSIDLLYSDCKHALDYAMAKKAEEQSELQKQALIVGHRLNIIMALFLPATAVASLLGMNITNGLESETSRNFMIVVIVTSLLGLVMRYWVLKKPRISFSEKSSEF